MTAIEGQQMDATEKQLREQIADTERANSQMLEEIKRLNEQVEELERSREREHSEAVRLSGIAIAQDSEFERLTAASEQLRTALAPFLAMARACKDLRDHEPIAALPNGKHRVIALDVRDFRTLATAASYLDVERRERGAA
jgi:septal ring factor EnvC (AmiA/AmiB activator)